MPLPRALNRAVPDGHIIFYYELNINVTEVWTLRREVKYAIVNLHPTRLGLSRMPQRRSVIQGRKNIFHRGPGVAVLQPAQLNGPPQFVAESKLFCNPRFPRSNPFHDLMDSEDVRLEFEVWVVSA